MAVNDLIHRAACFAIEAHAKQRRKYTDDAYIVHPMRVAAMVERVPGLNTATEAVAAAWLHDTIEDCGVSYAILKALFGEPIANLVQWLTHQFTAEAYPKMNRRERKIHEAERLSRAPAAAQSIKIADLYDNACSILVLDPEFAPTFAEEMERLLGALTLADHVLVAKGRDLLADYKAMHR